MARGTLFAGLLFALLLLHTIRAVCADRAAVVPTPIDVARAPLQRVPGSGVESVQVVYPSFAPVYSKDFEPVALSSQDTLVQVAQLDPVGMRSIAFGDTDHDGRNEAVFYWHDQNFAWHYAIREEQGNNVYSLEYIGADLIPWAIADLDQDGKAEIIGQFSYYVQVYESADAGSYPSQLVWSSSALSNVEGATTIGDTDRDGKMEIIHSLNTFGSSYLYIFENSGDNAYALVLSTYTGAQPAGEKVIADFDSDGLVEIAFCGLHGRLHVYESPADNAWVETFSDTTGLSNAYAAEGGVDTDANGRPELFIAGDRYADHQKTTVIYEAIGDNQFAQVATLPLTGDLSAGGASNALGSFDGTSQLTYVTQGYNHLWFYTASGVGEWNIRFEIQDPTASAWYIGVQVFDVNRNGKSELFWDSSRYPTLVLEHPPRTSDLGPSATGRLRPLLLSPNPFRVVATVVAPGANLHAEWLSVYDVAGRLVERVHLQGGQDVHVWDARRLSAGVYYVQLEAHGGTRLARGRGTIVR